MDACLVNVSVFKRHRHADSTDGSPGLFARYPFRCDEHPGSNDFEPTTGGHKMRTDIHHHLAGLRAPSSSRSPRASVIPSNGPELPAAEPLSRSHSPCRLCPTWLVKVTKILVLSCKYE